MGFVRRASAIVIKGGVVRHVTWRHAKHSVYKDKDRVAVMM